VCVVARACVVTGIGHDGSITRHGSYRVRTRDILRKRGVVLCGVVWCCVVLCGVVWVSRFRPPVPFRPPSEVTLDSWRESAAVCIGEES
jgi:hypothetical protein